jgi:hypothetical protein
LFLNQAANSVAQDFAETFVDHHYLCAGADRVVKLPLDGTEGTFHVTRLVVMLHVLFVLELEVVERSFKVPTNCPRRVGLERDVRLPVAMANMESLAGIGAPPRPSCTGCSATPLVRSKSNSWNRCSWCRCGHE